MILFRNQFADRITDVIDVLLNATRQLVLKIVFTSNPGDARVQLRPKYSQRVRSGNTEATFENVYRGLYSYEVTLAGYKPAKDELDLLDSAQSTVVCTLVPVSSPSDSGCRRK